VHEAERRAHSATRICVASGIGHLEDWQILSRHLGRRDHLETAPAAVAGRVCGQKQASRSDAHRQSKALTAGTAA
jgi:hypothetical protein